MGKKRKTLKDCLLKEGILGKTFESRGNSRNYDYNRYTVKGVIRSEVGNYPYLVLDNGQIRNLGDSLDDSEVLK